MKVFLKTFLKNGCVFKKFRFETTIQRDGPATFTSYKYFCTTCFKIFKGSGELGTHLRESVKNPNIPEILNKEAIEAKKEIESFQDNL